MSNFDDSSFEMHDDTLSPEDVEALIAGTSARPDLGELETLFAEVRALPNRIESPAISPALAEFVGVDLTPNPEPIELRGEDETIVLAPTEAPSAQPVRRNSMIGQAAAFLGTIGGKVVVGTTVAAASLSGAHATGAIDVPYLPDNEPAKIETIDLPEDPDALAFIEEEEKKDEVEKDEVADKEVEKTDEEQDKSESKIEKDESSFTGEDLLPYGVKEAEEKAKAEAEAEEKAKKEAEEKAKAEAEAEEKAKKEAEEKAKAEAEEQAKKEQKEKEAKTEAEKAKQEQIAALEEAVHIAKDKVRAEATALIKPLEEERDGLLADLEAAHKALAEEWEPIIDALLADLEATEDETERAQIEADIDAAESAWIAARVAAELEVDPRLMEIDDLFHVIETERDAEIDRLLAEFFAAVEAIEKS
ncbi:MAG: hypothetical protein R8J94_21085 [Acidimicrobiia bacterium]|nr:hypothetical protein [Acidimicrobiia bacterium]